MKITGLGHSELICEMENSKEVNISLLSDAWLSNYAFGDFMERSPRLNICFEDFPKLDGIFLSHAHCDHFDPYTLVELYKYQSPDLLIPETLSYLVDILKKYLPSAKIIILRDRENFAWKGLNLYGFIFRQNFLSNEDDVMILAVNNKKELLYIEVDTAIPESAEAYTEIWDLFHKNNYESVCHIVTRNELGGIFKSLDAKTVEERKEKVRNFIETIKEETELEYVKYEEGYVDYPNLADTKTLVRLFNGQGIVYPEDLGTEFDKVMIPLSLIEVRDIEKKIAKKYRKYMPIEALQAGDSFTITEGRIHAEACPDFLNNLQTRDFIFNENAEVFQKETSSKPLRKTLPEGVTEEYVRSCIIDALNNRFLPYQLASLDAPLRELTLRSPEKKFVIAVRFGNEDDFHTVYFSYSFAFMRFKVDKVLTKNKGAYNEIYWANDLYDFMQGRQEMFSTFLHHIEKNISMYFWNCLGMPFIASDFVQRKMTLHFERAVQGEKVDSYVKEFFERFTK